MKDTCCEDIEVPRPGYTPVGGSWNSYYLGDLRVFVNGKTLQVEDFYIEEGEYCHVSLSCQVCYRDYTYEVFNPVEDSNEIIFYWVNEYGTSTMLKLEEVTYMGSNLAPNLNRNKDLLLNIHLKAKKYYRLRPRKYSTLRVYNDLEARKDVEATLVAGLNHAFAQDGEDDSYSERPTLTEGGKITEVEINIPTAKEATNNEVPE